MGALASGSCPSLATVSPKRTEIIDAVMDTETEAPIDAVMDASARRFASATCWALSRGDGIILLNGSITKNFGNLNIGMRWIRPDRLTQREAKTIAKDSRIRS